VLGLNGSGKSSLLRIMAGEDQQFLGEAFPSAGISVGFSAAGATARCQEKRASRTVEEGVADIRALLKPVRTR